jgi:NAD(P)-dependent dehydrogenase (short-subunit alcohol dehydrogenase family)
MPVSEVVVITGASAGVGRATVRPFAKRRASIVLIARDTEGLQAAAEEVKAAGGRALPLAIDVADPDAVESAAERVESQLGPIDIWINVAMATIYAPLHRIAAEEFRRATEITYLGNVYGTMAALKRMRPRSRGTIVQVGSALAYRAIPLQAPYCGAKFAIPGFTDSLRSELLHDRINIHLTMVQMPALNTPQFDWGRNKLSKRPQPVPPIFQPEVAAEAIVFAAYTRRREVWVGGPTIKAILANKLAPGRSIDISRVRGIADSSLPSPRTLPHRTTYASRCRAIAAPMDALVCELRRGAPPFGPRCTRAPCLRAAPWPVSRSRQRPSPPTEIMSRNSPACTWSRRTPFRSRPCAHEASTKLRTRSAFGVWQPVGNFPQAFGRVRSRGNLILWRG